MGSLRTPPCDPTGAAGAARVELPERARRRARKEEDARVPASRYGLPIQNKEVRDLQKSIELIKDEIQAKRLSAAVSDSNNAARLSSGKFVDRVLAAVRADDRAKGELLRSSFHLLKPGLERVRVPDYSTDPPTEVEIELDPKRDPGEQVAHCFARAKRAEGAVAHAREVLPGMRADFEILEQVLAALADEVDDDDLGAIVATLPDALRVDAEREARGARGEDAVLHGELVGWKPLRCPLHDLNLLRAQAASQGCKGMLASIPPPKKVRHGLSE